MTLARRLKRSVWLGLLATFLAAFPAAAAVSYGQPFPRTTVGYTRPPVGLHLLLTEGDRVEDAVLLLDGRPLAWERQGPYLAAVPPAPLSPGWHEAAVTVRFNAPWAPLRLEWRFRVAPGAVDALPDPDPRAAEVLRLVNEVRGRADLPPLAVHPALAAAAAAHAAYYVRNPLDAVDLSAHRESPDRPGFTGTEPWERGAYFGYPFTYYAEDMHFLGDHRQATAEWRDSVYHRLPLLEPAAEHLGYAQATLGEATADVLQIGATTLREAAEGLPEAVIYPVPGQTGVPVAWDANEVPDPYRFFTGSTGAAAVAGSPGGGPGSEPERHGERAGYPLTIQFPRREVASAVVLEASLRTAAGDAVPLWVLDSSRDEHIRPHVALLPRTVLAPGTRYLVSLTARLSLRDGGQRLFSRTFWFTTAAPAAEPVPIGGVYLDGRPVAADVPSVVRGGRSYLPARRLLTALGLEVAWDGHRRTVTATGSGRTIVLKVDNDLALVDGRPVPLDAAPFIWRDRVLVPVRFAAETMGLAVRWDDSSREVRLETAPPVPAPAAPKP